MFDDHLARSVAQQRFRTRLLLFPAATATLISAVGVIAVTATSVGRKRREIAIKLALGARAGRIVRAFMLGDALGPTLAGVVVGAVLAMCLSGIVRRIVPEPADLSATTYGLASAVILASSGVSAYLVARLFVRRSPASGELGRLYLPTLADHSASHQ